MLEIQAEMNPDIRWKQRLLNFNRALTQLTSAVELAGQRSLSDLERLGVIQGFEFVHELGWNVLKDYLEFQGHVGLIGSRDTVREAFRRGLIGDGEIWMEMIKARNLTSHAYDHDTAEGIYNNILGRFFPEFQDLQANFTRRSTQEL